MAKRSLCYATGLLSDLASNHSTSNWDLEDLPKLEEISKIIDKVEMDVMPWISSLRRCVLGYTKHVYGKCSVCLEELDDNFVLLGCFHPMHLDCTNELLKKSPSRFCVYGYPSSRCYPVSRCPLCRVEFWRPFVNEK